MIKIEAKKLCRIPLDAMPRQRQKTRLDLLDKFSLHCISCISYSAYQIRSCRNFYFSDLPIDFSPHSRSSTVFVPFNNFVRWILPRIFLNLIIHCASLHPNCVWPHYELSSNLQSRNVEGKEAHRPQKKKRARNGIPWEEPQVAVRAERRRRKTHGKKR